MVSALCTNDTLQELKVCSNPIGGDGATAFAEMMLTNETLKVLRLCDDSIGIYRQRYTMLDTLCGKQCDT